MICHFLMSRLNEFDLPAGSVQRAKDAIDAIAGVPIDSRHAPLFETADEPITGFLSHKVLQIPDGNAAGNSPSIMRLRELYAVGACKYFASVTHAQAVGTNHASPAWRAPTSWAEIGQNG